MHLGTCLLGRAIDAYGAPLDYRGLAAGRRVALGAPAPAPHERIAVTEPLWTGIRAVDGLLTIGCGARVGIFGAPGAGKSTLLESIVDAVEADAVVVGLVGERGREAQRWIERCDSRTTVVCATSDRPAQERVKAARVTFAHAQALCERGLHVVVVLDSLARIAGALRELGIRAGEGVGRGGYPPSVFAELAGLVERAGCFASGSVSLLATVLNDGDDRDPVSESARSLLDGHIQLSPKLADAGRYPAIDVCASASRTMGDVTTPQHRLRAARVRSALAALEATADARSLGIEAVDALTRTAVAAEGQIEAFLRQGREASEPAITLSSLAEVADTLDVPHGYHD